MSASESSQIAKLEAEFPGYQIWTDIRSREDGGDHWHARKPGCSTSQASSTSVDEACGAAKDPLLLLLITRVLPVISVIRAA